MSRRAWQAGMLTMIVIMVSGCANRVGVSPAAVGTASNASAASAASSPSGSANNHTTSPTTGSKASTGVEAEQAAVIAALTTMLQASVDADWQTLCGALDPAATLTRQQCLASARLASANPEKAQLVRTASQQTLDNLPAPDAVSINGDKATVIAGRHLTYLFARHGNTWLLADTSFAADTSAATGNTAPGGPRLPPAADAMPNIRGPWIKAIAALQDRKWERFCSRAVEQADDCLTELQIPANTFSSVPCTAKACADPAATVGDVAAEWALRWSQFQPSDVTVTADRFRVNFDDDNWLTGHLTGTQWWLDDTTVHTIFAQANR